MFWNKVDEPRRSCFGNLRRLTRDDCSHWKSEWTKKGFIRHHRLPLRYFVKTFGESLTLIFSDIFANWTFVTLQQKCNVCKTMQCELLLRWSTFWQMISDRTIKDWILSRIYIPLNFFIQQTKSFDVNT